MDDGAEDEYRAAGVDAQLAAVAVGCEPGEDGADEGAAGGYGGYQLLFG